MPEAGSEKIRVYCICGQKMRVSASMLGRPGKCVACRQKIRIPRLEELPAGVMDIYLRDHPEFLRRPKARAVVSEAPRIEAEDGENLGEAGEDLALGEGADQREYLPLDILEPLRIICSFEYCVRHGLERLRKGAGAADAAERAKLMSYRVLVRNARNGLDEGLRGRLHEVVAQLSGVIEQIREAESAFRSGEMDSDTYAQTVTALRHRREYLERQNQNLRGWLAASDPYLAGGYSEVKLEDVPCEGVEITFPPESPSGSPLFEETIEQLRASLVEYESAERLLRERRRVAQEAGKTGAPTGDVGAHLEGRRRRARAAAAYHRERLEQVVKDCDTDVAAIRAHLEQAQGRISRGQLTESAFRTLEMKLLRAQTDIRSARALATQAIAAQAAHQVPNVEGVLVRRFSRFRGPGSGLGPDSWVAWCVAGLMVVTMLAPVSNAGGGGNIVVARGMVVGLFLGAALVAMVACIPRRDVRGVLISMVVLAAGVIGAILVSRAWYSLGAIGVAMRADEFWYMRPGILLMMLELAGLGLAAAIALYPFPSLRFLPAGVVALTIVIVAGVLTDAGGLLAPYPYLDEPELVLSDRDSGIYHVSIVVGNHGWGRRTLWLGGQAAQTPHAARLVLERRIGADSWENAGLPGQIKPDDAGWRPVAASQALPVLSLRPGHEIAFRYFLPPGTYQIQLSPAYRAGDAIVRTFTLVELLDDLPPPPTEAVPADLAPAPETPTETAPSAPPKTPSKVLEVELRGVIDSAGHAPSFAMVVHLPSGEVQRRNLVLGDVVYGEWKTYEFSPANKTLALSDGAQLLVFRPGERLTLPVSEPSQVGGL